MVFKFLLRIIAYFFIYIALIGAFLSATGDSPFIILVAPILGLVMLFFFKKGIPVGTADKLIEISKVAEKYDDPESGEDEEERRSSPNYAYLPQNIFYKSDE